jgi:CubicO group peptidase (beta-lactamase class C family)
MKQLLFTFFAALVFGVASAQAPFITDSLDQYITTGMKDWQVPGLSIVIVKDGKVVKLQGYGVKNIATNERVDANTLFMIASNTKLFTGTALAQLAHYNKLSLNDKITQYFPDYQLYDQTSTALVTVRDLLTHRIGTKTFQGDFTFWNSKLSRKAIMEKMRLLKPVGNFRQDYGYCNSCFLTAGEVIQKVSGQPWEVYVYDSIIIPTGMTNTHALSQGIEQRKNVATPYTTSYTNQLNQVPYDQWDNLAPAASIVSNVTDLAKWLQLQLDSGKVNGKQVLPWKVLQATRDVNIVTGSRKSAIFPMNFRGYGLGVFAADYNGKQIYWHTGGAGGMVSNVCFVPEANLGIAILTNNDNQNLFEALRYQILDAYLGVPYVNRSKQQLAGFNKEMEEQVATIAGWKKLAAAGISAPLPLKAYAGNYHNELYGNLTIKTTETGLYAQFLSHSNLAANLTYMGNDEWLLAYTNIEYGIFKIKFTTNKEKVQSVEIKANDFVEYDSYTFTKSPTEKK